MDRIEKLCAYLDKCETFADVGCDHAYCALHMLKNNLCESAVVSDISEKCLEKARKLLRGYISEGTVRAVCCNGLERIPEDTEQVLIAGMGGEEIVNILKNSFIPRKFVLQPMKNARLVREYLIAGGAEICVDTYFESGGKFYPVIKGKNCGVARAYSKEMLEYGGDLSSEGTREYIKCELKKKRGYLERDLNERARKEILRTIKIMEEVLANET